MKFVIHFCCPQRGGRNHLNWYIETATSIGDVYLHIYGSPLYMYLIVKKHHSGIYSICN